MVLSYNYSNRNSRRRRTNAPPSRAILMAMAVRWCDTACIARWWRLMAFMKATNLLHWVMRAVLYRRIATAIDQQRGGDILLIVVLIVALAAAGAIRSK